MTRDGELFERRRRTDRLVPPPHKPTSLSSLEAVLSCWTVERHKDHPMAQIKLNQQETAEQILRLRPSHINGVPVKNWERLSNDPSAFLILWEGGWVQKKFTTWPFCSDGFQQNVRGLQSFGLGNFKPEDEGERHFHNLKLHKLWYG